MNKVVLITGGSRGIGKSTSEIFSKNGYDIIIFYNKDEDARILSSVFFVFCSVYTIFDLWSG